VRARDITVVIAATLFIASCAGTGVKPGDGVNVGDASELRKLVPAEDLEKSSAQQYAGLLQQASAKGALAADSDKQLVRLRKISAYIIPQAGKFNPRANQWKWEVNLIRSEDINAFCMPGGKIGFYTGILEKLKLTDDEIAVVMGHEMAHALREHGREQIAKQGLTNVGSDALATAVGGTAGSLVKSGAGLLSLKFSRDDETDADLVGLELSARAGYNPNAGVTLWKKMAAASKGAPYEWFSTHPSSETRIATIHQNIAAVMPLYEEAKKTKAKKS
jgi:Zn-dependent protease with chaperone function